MRDFLIQQLIDENTVDTVVDHAALVRSVAKECAKVCRDRGQSATYSYTPARAAIATRTAQGCATIIEHMFGVPSDEQTTQ